MVHGNAVFIREAKLARNTHWYTFFNVKLHFFQLLYFHEHKANVVLHGAESFALSQQLARNLKSSTIKGLKSLS